MVSYSLEDWIFPYSANYFLFDYCLFSVADKLSSDYFSAEKLQDVGELPPVNNTVTYSQPIFVVVLMVVVMWFADSFCGRYKVLKVSFFISAAIPPLLIIAGYVPNRKLKMSIYMFSNFLAALCYAIKGIILAFAIDQIVFPTEIRRLRPYVFVLIESVRGLTIFLALREPTLTKIIAACVLFLIVAITFTLNVNRFTLNNPKIRIVEDVAKNSVQYVKQKLSPNRRGKRMTSDHKDEDTPRYVSKPKAILRLLLYVLLYSFLCQLTMKIQQKSFTRSAISLPGVLDIVRYEVIWEICMFMGVIICEINFEWLLNMGASKHSEIRMISVGLVISLCSLLLALQVHRTLEETNLYRPKADSAQLVFYNTLNESVSLSPEKSKTFVVKPLNKLVVVNMRHISGYVKKNFTVSSKTLNTTAELYAYHGKSYSVVITKTGLRLMPFADPNDDNKEKYLRYAMIFLVFGVDRVDGTFIYKEKHQRIFIIRIRDGPNLFTASIWEGNYTVITHMKNGNFNVIEHTYFLRHRYMYAFVIYNDDKGQTSAMIHQIRTPQHVPVYLILPQLFLHILGLSIAEISWLVFLIFHTPADIRGLVFTVYFGVSYIYSEIFEAYIVLDPRMIFLYISCHLCVSILLLYVYVVN